jgi:hypothetical protein
MVISHTADIARKNTLKSINLFFYYHFEKVIIRLSKNLANQMPILSKKVHMQLCH